MTYEIRFSNRAKKQVKLLSKKQQAKLKSIFINVISINPFLGKKLRDDLKGNYSLRLNIKDRIVYEIQNEDKIVIVKEVRTHYGD